MTEFYNVSRLAGAAIPPDDPKRQLTVVDPDSPTVRHVTIAGGTYSILVTGEESGGRYCLIDMHVPPGGDPPQHRHDLEEMFTLLEGDLEFAFRGMKSIIRAGSTVNIPANAPHSFKNVSNDRARMLCMCTPPGQEQFFMEVGDRVDSRTAAPPKLSQAEQEARKRKALELSSKCRTEILLC